MSKADLVGTFIRPLSAAGVTFMITGSVAATIYGEPRFTQDIDLVLTMSAADVARLTFAFPPDAFYCPPSEVIAEEVARTRGGHFNLLHHESGWRADCYVAGERELEAWALGNRRILRAGDTDIPVAPPEYVILSKLEYYQQSHSARHPDDIRRMLRVSGSLIDRDVISTWAERLGVEQEWREVREPGR